MTNDNNGISDDNDNNDNDDINDDTDNNDNNENDFFPHNIVVAATARVRRSLFLVYKSFSQYNRGCQICTNRGDQINENRGRKINSHSAAHAQCCRSTASPFEDQLFGLNIWNI